MEEALRALLQGSSAVTALVSADLVNWGPHPQGPVGPYIALLTVSGIEGLTMQGATGMEEFRVQIDCYGPSYSGAKAAARAVKSALHGYRSGGFRLIEHAGSRDSREGGSNEAERLFRSSQDFIINWRA